MILVEFEFETDDEEDDDEDKDEGDKIVVVVLNDVLGDRDEGEDRESCLDACVVDVCVVDACVVDALKESEMDVCTPPPTSAALIGKVFLDSFHSSCKPSRSPVSSAFS